MDGDDEGRGEPLGDERGEDASRGDDALTSSCRCSWLLLLLLLFRVSPERNRV